VAAGQLRIGYKASAEQFAPRELVEYAVRAEEVGLDSVVTSDHFLPWRHEGGHAPSSLAWFAAVGERTSRVLIGTSVVTPSFAVMSHRYKFEFMHKSGLGFEAFGVFWDLSLQQNVPLDRLSRPDRRLPPAPRWPAHRAAAGGTTHGQTLCA
jgi:hypothetical protein